MGALFSRLFTAAPEDHPEIDHDHFLMTLLRAGPYLEFPDLHPSGVTLVIHRLEQEMVARGVDPVFDPNVSLPRIFLADTEPDSNQSIHQPPKIALAVGRCRQRSTVPNRRSGNASASNAPTRKVITGRVQKTNSESTRRAGSSPHCGRLNKMTGWETKEAKKARKKAIEYGISPDVPVIVVSAPSHFTDAGPFEDPGYLHPSESEAQNLVSYRPKEDNPYLRPPTNRHAVSRRWASKLTRTRLNSRIAHSYRAASLVKEAVEVAGAAKVMDSEMWSDTLEDIVRQGKKEQQLLAAVQSWDTKIDEENGSKPARCLPCQFGLEPGNLTCEEIATPAQLATDLEAAASCVHPTGLRVHT
jgi:hypothetical protein